MIGIVHLKEAWRYYKRANHVRKNGFKRYSGNALEISKQIVDKCWNEKFFQTSAGHFNQFWTRDFAFCTQALDLLGHRKKVFASLAYALDKFSKHGKVTTAITPEGIPFDFPNMAADSLPLLIHSIRIVGADYLLMKHKDFLMKEIDRYFQTVFDHKTSMVYEGKSFSSIKDYAKRKSATYDNCMLAMMKDDLKALEFYNPFKNYDIKKAIQDNLWNGSYFYEDMSHKNVVTGDANVFPFWTGVFTDKKMFKSCLKQMQKAKLDKPFPLKYSSSKEATTKTLWYEKLAGDYERDVVWMHLGGCFVDVVKKFDKKQFQKYIKQYTDLIENYGNYHEVFNPDGTPFTTKYYVSDDSMLWAAKYAVQVQSLSTF